MSKGENIFKRMDGRWEARYVKGRKLDGKIQYGYCYGKTYREAKEKVSERKASVTMGISEEKRCKKQLEQYCDEWLSVSRTKLKDATYAKYRNILKNHIKPHLGMYPVQAINVQILSDFCEKLLLQLSPKSTKDVLVVLHSVLKHAGLQVDMPYPRVQRGEMRVLTVEEQKTLMNRLLDSSDRRDQGILLALLTGMRIGELCALRWEDVSIKDKTICVRTTMQRLQCDDQDHKTKILISSPKSEKSVRIIPMTELAVSVCFNLGNGNGFVLTGSNQFIEPRAMQYRLEKITKECNLPDVHFHTLRHTFATRCVEVGFEIKSLSEVMGHSATGVTLDRYIHASLALKRENICKLEKIGM